MSAVDRATPPLPFADCPADCDRVIESCNRFGLVGRSDPFLCAVRLLVRLAQFDVPVLIGGESGTGKELFARALHYMGVRRAGPFVPVNCSALPDSLLESEMFGHARGAFTDARAEFKGLVAQADGGTLFLDEVHCLSPKGQASLLRFVQDKVFRPLGCERLRHADVKIVAASNRPLASEVAAGRFREDLLYRLKVADLELPPLRERKEDIPMLVEKAVEGLCTRFHTDPRRFDAASLAWLAAQSWPGNIRELENFVCCAFLLSDGPLIHLPACAARTEPARPGLQGTSFNDARARAVADFEAQYLRTMLALTRGNVTEAARLSGKDRRVFGRLMRKYGIERRDYL